MANHQRRKKESQERGTGIVDQASVMRIFKERAKPLGFRELLAGLGAYKADRGKLLDILDVLVETGRIIQIQEAWGLAESMHLVTGKIEVQRSGVGYVLCEDKRRKDIFINPRDFNEAWHGDQVVVALTKQTGKSPEGRVVRVLERSITVQPCRVERRIRQGLLLCHPSDPRHTHAFLVESPAGRPEPQVGDVLTVTIGERMDFQLYSGDILEALGPENDVAVQETLVKLNHNVPSDFPAAALSQAETLPKVPGEDDFQGRQDLRHLDFVTIDGVKARDFDDAVYVERTASGYTLWVAIADVAHYVPEGSPLDLEAMERGNSFYFPQSVEPMFPEALSNGLCSLNPQVPRLAMVAQTDFSADGLPGKSRFYPAVIFSKARLTYSQVNRALLLGDEAEREAIIHVMPMLETAETLARQLKARRGERGSLNFDLPEPEILFNIEGETENIRPRVRHFGHQLIEEFMIAANEAVARFLTEKQVAIPYRVHPEPDPDKLTNLFKMLSISDFAQNMPTAPTAKSLRLILAKAEGTPQEFLVSRLTLRSMMQARYNTVNQGHYGLASECYTHFTSPIRRYADLMVHRALKAHLAGKPTAPEKKVQGVCDGISLRERSAMEAEREILKRITVLFLQDKVGQTFTGIINSMADFGFWVELAEVMAEGMVRLSTLTDDYYTFFPERQMLLGQRTGKIYRLGQKVSVELTDVQLGRLEVNLRLVGEDDATMPGGGASKGKRRDRDRGDRNRGGRKGQGQSSGKDRGPRETRPEPALATASAAMPSDTGSKNSRPPKGQRQDAVLEPRKAPADSTRADADRKRTRPPKTTGRDAAPEAVATPAVAVRAEETPKRSRPPRKGTAAAGAAPETTGASPDKRGGRGKAREAQSPDTGRNTGAGPGTGAVTDRPAALPADAQPKPARAKRPQAKVAQADEQAGTGTVKRSPGDGKPESARGNKPSGERTAANRTKNPSGERPATERIKQQPAPEDSRRAPAKTTPPQVAEPAPVAKEVTVRPKIKRPVRLRKPSAVKKAAVADDSRAGGGSNQSIDPASAVAKPKRRRR